MKKICVITAARSEYGLLKWLMKDIKESCEYEFQLIVTGAHLCKEQGYTVDDILSDGFHINYIVDCNLCTISTNDIAYSMGTMAQGFSKAFSELNPDFVIVLGDRYELLPICSTALIMRIPILHISGGDITEGAIDNYVRNAVTMMADFHFPGTNDAANNIKRMRGQEKSIWNVGELGLDSFNRESLLTREILAQNLGLKIDAEWALMTYHAETKSSLEYNLNTVNACITELSKIKNLQILITYSNADYGGMQINNLIEELSVKYPGKFFVVPSLGHLRYLSFMKQVKFVIGNSSSGIVEAPFLRIPVVNIGNRQKGRYLCANIVQSDGSANSISKSIDKALKLDKSDFNDYNYWGDGFSSKRIMRILKEEIKL